MAVVALGAFTWLAACAMLVLLSAGDLRAGQESFRDVHEEDRVAEVLKGSLTEDLHSAERRMSRADDRLSSPVLAPARLLPVVGRQIRSLDALAAAGSRLADVGSDGIAEAGRLLQGPASADDRVVLVRQVGELAQRTRRRLEPVSLGPRKGLLPPLARARNQLADEFSEVRDGLARAASGSEAMSGFLAGPRRYLIFAANNAEMRAGSGMFLSVGVLETSGGRLTLNDFQTVFDLPVPPGAVPLEGDLADRWGWLHPNHDWRNLMLSPRFDASAALAARMWEAIGEPPVDGVIALDPVFLEQVLKILGPITVEGIKVDATNVVDELIHNQYLRYPRLEERPERRESLGRIARATFATLDSGTWSVPDMAEAFSSTVRSRHVMAWSARPEEQEGWRAAGADGSLRPESLLVAVLNRGGNKLDRYLSISANLACTPSEAETACALRLDLHNVTPPGEPPYIAGPHPGSGVNEGDYLGIVSVNLPGAAQQSSIDGVGALAVAGSDGPGRVVGFQLVVPRNEKRTVTVRFRLPGRHGSVRVEPSARVPGIKWSSGDVTWKDGASRTLRW